VNIPQNWTIIIRILLIKGAHVVRLAIGLGAAVLLTSFAAAYDTSPHEFTGGWRLHSAGAHFIDPQNAPRDLIWDIKIDHRNISWNMAVIPLTGGVRFESFDAELDGKPRMVVGSKTHTMGEARIINGDLAIKLIHTHGPLKEILSTCTIAADKKQLICKGKGIRPDDSIVEFDVSFDRT
jgi:hypothetical protein